MYPNQSQNPALQCTRCTKLVCTFKINGPQVVDHKQNISILCHHNTVLTKSKFPPRNRQNTFFLSMQVKLFFYHLGEILDPFRGGNLLFWGTVLYPTMRVSCNWCSLPPSYKLHTVSRYTRRAT